MWEAIRNIEECGLKVIIVTADGASPNRKFFKMHQASKKPGEVVYKTPNPYSLDSRDIYFMSDVPHLKQLEIAGQTHSVTPILVHFG